MRSSYQDRKAQIEGLRARADGATDAAIIAALAKAIPADALAELAKAAAPEGGTLADAIEARVRKANDPRGFQIGTAVPQGASNITAHMADVAKANREAVAKAAGPKPLTRREQAEADRVEKLRRKIDHDVNTGGLPR